MKGLWTVVVIAALALGLAGCGGKPTPVATGAYNVSGRVHKPVKNLDGSQAGYEGVEVVATTSSGAVKTTTGPDGTYTFTGLTGTATITVAAPDGWNPVTPLRHTVGAAATGRDFVAGRPVVFVSNRDTSYTQVFLMNPDGTNQQPLFSPDGRTHSYPALSPDGTKVAFHVSDGSESGIYLAELTGGAVQKVTDLPNVSFLTWSPDGQKIAYAKAWSLQSLLQVDARPGAVPDAIPVDDESPVHPSFSPDGTRLACQVAASVWIVDVSKGVGDVLTLGTHPVWSPAGNRIAYVNNNRLYVYDLDTDTPTPLTEAGAFYRIYDPHWSADGKLLYFNASNDAGRYDIYSIKATGGDAIPLTDTGSNAFDGWYYS